MHKFRIAGVPEHFNFPWQLAIEQNLFKKQEIDLQWIEVPEGTGKMCDMLRKGETDLAIVLTEGIVKDIAAGNPSKIVQLYVASPLVWGVHVSATSPYHKLAELENRTAAISKPGSGSHLMACVLAQQKGWNIDSLTFETVHTIGGAVEALTRGSADYFIWERFTTKPYVDRHIFRKIADCQAPWPALVIAARQKIIEEEKKVVSTLLKVINDVTRTFKKLEHIEETLAAQYHLNRSDIHEWLASTEWSERSMTKQAFSHLMDNMTQLKLIDTYMVFEQVFATVAS